MYRSILCNLIKQSKRMYNQPSSSTTLSNSQSVSIVIPEFSPQNYPKVLDNTMPTPTLRHYSSNPNISLHHLNPRPTQQHPPQYSHFDRQLLNRNAEYRGFLPSNTRPRNELTKSLIMNEAQKAETPEEVPSPKKEFFRNMPRRPRMSETTIEEPPRDLLPNKQEPAREVNFYKNKEQREDQAEKLTRQTPYFLRRANSNIMDMKRSLVADSSFEHRVSSPLMRKKQWRKVSLEDFIKLKQLGSGKYGRVYLAVERYSNFMCALKVIEKKLLREQEIVDQFTRQVKIQMFLNHPNIIKMYGCFQDQLNIYIILEVGSGGQLYHHLKKSQPLDEPRIAFIMKQVCDAVNLIHSLRIIHRDIKPENIVLHDNIIKLCDFGWSVHQDNKLRTTFCGTPLYVCPEILKGREYDEKIDIWSIGIMMYEMVVGENPFKITREEQLIKIVKDQIKIPSYLFVSNEVRDLLDRCLQKNPAERASIKEVINHPFFKKHQDKNDKSKLLAV